MLMMQQGAIEEQRADLYVAILVVKGTQVEKGLNSFFPCLPNPNEEAACVGNRCLPCCFYGPEP